MKRDYKLYVQDAIDSLSKIQGYMEDVSEEQFMKDEKLQDAVIRRFEIVGEAVKNIPRVMKQANKEVPWAKISSFRDFMVHSYFVASLQRIWEIATKDVPAIKENFLKIKVI
jgi:uncharacterized protein with HEPN domain